MSSTSWATPVAPIGWPFAFRPPLGLTGMSPSSAVRPSAAAGPPSPVGTSPSASVAMTSAPVKQSWTSARSTASAPKPASA